MRTYWIGCLGLVVVAGSVQAAVVYDHFDDGLLDPAWNITFSDATGWSYAESGTELTVSDILGAPRNTGSGGLWGLVSLDRDFSSLGDFDLASSFSWDSEGSVMAMQYVYVVLSDGAGTVVASCGHSDGWVLYSGTRYARLGQSLVYNPGYGTAPLSGSADVTISRSGGTVDITWDGETVLTGPNAAAVENVAIRFGFYNYLGTSFFGRETVDLVHLVPEPATLSLLALGGLVVLRRRAR